MLLFALPACRTVTPLPQQDWPGTRAALQVLADRAASIDALSAACRMNIQTSEGDTVTLDGVMIVAQPDRMRLQAWKFDQRVFDLTTRDGELWVWADERAGDMSERFPKGMGGDASGGTSGGVSGGWLGPLMQPLDPDAAEVIEDDPDGGTLTVRWPIGDEANGWSWIAVIDRATITYRELRVLDSDQQVVQRLKLSEYELIGTPDSDMIPWPMRLEGSGRMNIALKLDDVELNPDLPAAAFDPPSDAEMMR